MESRNSIVWWLHTKYFVNSCFWNNDKPPILFLHGRGQSGDCFREFFSEFEKKWVPCIAIDFPWFWWSAYPWNEWTVWTYAKYIKSFIDKIWLSEVMVVWHSFWCRIVIKIESELKYFKKIILIWAWWIQQNTENKIVSWLKKSQTYQLLKNSFVWDWYRKKKWSSDYLNSWSMKQIFLNVINEDLTDNLSSINNETILIWWSNDIETPIEHWKIMNEKINNSKLYVIENWSHFVFQEKFNETFRLIDNFYESN